jgi:hypothetical protein
MQNDATLTEKSASVLQKKKWNYDEIQKLIVGCIFKAIGNKVFKRYLCTMYITLFIIVSTYKQHQCPCTD